MSYLFSFSRYQRKCVIKFLFSQLMMSQTIRFMLINLWSDGWQGEKEWKTEIQKFEYLENEKSFLDEIKNIFHSFWRPIIWLKLKNWWKIADTSFHNFIIYDVTIFFTNNCNHILLNISLVIGNQTMNFGQLKEYKSVCK